LNSGSASHGEANAWTGAAVKPFARRESDWLTLFAPRFTEREHGCDRRQDRVRRRSDRDQVKGDCH
jgi:hypothetical protein